MKMDKENITVKTQSSGNLMVVSLILMVLSCVLFVGTTLAWFTDQTSGGVNRIQAGNLEAVLVIGEGSTTTNVPLDSPSGAQPVNAETAVPLQMHKLNVTESTEDENTNSTEETDGWNPGDIFISDVMQVVKAYGSVPFDYKLELLIDPTEQSTESQPETVPPKASDYIDFRIVDVSTISTVNGDTRTYKYADIAAYFGSAGEVEDSEELPVPIWLLADEENGASGQTQQPTNVFSSEVEDGVQFVILAKLKQPNIGTEDIELSNPFSLIVTLKQLNAEHFEPAAEAGDAS